MSDAGRAEGTVRIPGAEQPLFCLACLRGLHSVASAAAEYSWRQMPRGGFCSGVSDDEHLNGARKAASLMQAPSADCGIRNSDGQPPVKPVSPHLPQMQQTSPDWKMRDPLRTTDSHKQFEANFDQALTQASSGHYGSQLPSEHKTKSHIKQIPRGEENQKNISYDDILLPRKLFNITGTIEHET
ncbi:hypothetical protein GW17_00011242 [Ensete ventricosum]|nr:hypothetical protein GW17_00011242 [Ensete ventricosum]